MGKFVFHAISIGPRWRHCNEECKGRHLRLTGLPRDSDHEDDNAEMKRVAETPFSNRYLEEVEESKDSREEPDKAGYASTASS